MTQPTSTALKSLFLRARALFGKSLWGIIDQVLISGTNFVTAVMLARQLSLAAFGAYSIVYSLLLLSNGIQAGLITQAHNTVGSTKSGKDYQKFTASAALIQVVLSFTLSVLALVTWFVAWYCEFDCSSLLIALVPAIFCWQYQEFFRKILYTEFRYFEAVLNDIVSYGGQILVMAALWSSGLLTAPNAFYAIAATSFFAACIGAWQTRTSWLGTIDLSTMREIWTYGKWLAGTAFIGYWVSTQLFIYVAAAVAGAAAAAVLKAVDVIFGPTRILVYAVNAMLPMRFAKAYAHGGQSALRKELKRILLTVVPVLFVCCSLIALFPEKLLQIVFGGKYLGYGLALSLYSVSAFFSYVGPCRTIPSKHT